MSIEGTKIKDLTGKTTPDPSDEVVLNDVENSNVDKKATLDNLVKGMIQIPTTAFKSADQGVAVDNFTNDLHLFLPLKINTLYYFLLAGKNQSSSGTAQDIKYTFTVPTNATLKYATSGASTFIMLDQDESTGLINATINEETTYLWGIIEVGDTAGNLQFQFAQNLEDTGKTIIMLKGSCLKLWELGPA